MPFVKQRLANLFYLSGLATRVLRIKFANSAAVLMYHRVIDSTIAKEIALQPSMYVEPATFENHLLELKKQFKIVPLSKLLARQQNGKDIGQYCSVTLDDGWLDNYKSVYPLLLKYKLPVTIFLATNYIGTEKRFWPEQVSCHLLQILRKGNEAILPRKISDFIAGLHYGSCQVNEIVDKVIVFLKSFSPQQRMDLVNQICAIVPDCVHSERIMMNWDEVREMAGSGFVDFGAHTESHELLDQMESEAASKEIALSKERIEDELKRPCRLFSYPNGNYNRETLKAIRNVEFIAAVTTERGKFSTDTDCMTIPRIGIHQDVSNNTPLLYWRLVVK